MSKGSNLNSGFLVLYDWLPALESLSGEDCKSLLLALVKRQKDGQPLPVFENQLVNVFAGMIEPTIKRRLDGQAGGNKAKADTTIVPTTDTTIAPTIPSRAEQSKDKQSKDKHSIQSPQKPPVGADVTAERFDAFWNAYPKKVGKGAAEKIFKKLKPSGDLLQKMLDAIEVQKQSDQWKRDNGQYIPNPATWLNQTRWEDSVGVEKMPDYSMEELIALGLI